MATPLDRRQRKREAVRQSISDAATRLFVAHGFDAVTVDDIAAAADVSRKTVFNHFPRKEDMFFDLTEEGIEDLSEAFARRDPSLSVIEGLRRFAHQAVAERRPYVRFMEGSEKFVATVVASEALKARARGIRDELTTAVASRIASAWGKQEPDADATFAATLLVATWAAAFVEGHRVFRQTHDAKLAQESFVATIDKGSTGISAALKWSSNA